MQVSRRTLIKLVLTLVALAIMGSYTYSTYRQIEAQAGRDEARPADAIVVFGAAEYAGRPSPVYRARLDHAKSLFEKNLAPLVITTGGHGPDPVYNEGGVGRDYLVKSGLPETQVVAETQSDDTADSARRVATILRANGLTTCIAVSDGYHIHRIKQMLQREGINVYGSPRPVTRPLSASQMRMVYLREALSLTLWRLRLG